MQFCGRPLSSDVLNSKETISCKPPSLDEASIRGLVPTSDLTKVVSGAIVSPDFNPDILTRLPSAVLEPPRSCMRVSARLACYPGVCGLCETSSQRAETFSTREGAQQRCPVR
jgi:hypothetical protein